MIDLSRLDGSRFVLNAELIRQVEERPDTVITLVGGERIIVVESMREVVSRVLDYRRLLRTIAPSA